MTTSIPAARQPQGDTLARGRLDDDQIIALLQAIHESRVEQKEGQGSHLQVWDVRRHLLRIFGWGGFDIETRSTRQAAVREARNGSVTVVYDATVRLIVRDRRGLLVGHWDGSACGHETSGQDGKQRISVGDAFHNAISTAESTALKRAATNLGDQFGLSLYNNGSTHPVVLRSIAHLGGALAPGLEPFLAKPVPQQQQQQDIGTSTTTDDAPVPTPRDSEEQDKDSDDEYTESHDEEYEPTDH